MSWIGFLALLVVSLLLQTTLGRLFGLSLVHVDLMLVLALVYALIAPVNAARLACLFCGLAIDLMTEGPFGIHAFAFGLTGLVLTKLRDTVNRQLWWVRLLIGFVAALAGQLLILLHLRFVQAGHLGSWRGELTLAVLLSAEAALFAALLTQLPPLRPRYHSLARSPRSRR
jgi:rod shape-determining protein MreD